MCFNGVWRVNRKGEFNVPFGGKANPGFPSLDHLRICAKALQAAELRTSDFFEAVEEAKSGDFVYMDPPYLPVSSTSYFRHYTAERFSDDDHERVSKIVRELTARGVRVMITEADSLVARGWYADCHVVDRAVTRSVASKGHRFEVSELIITNYRSL
jgi:DNA adenine methylase